MLYLSLKRSVNRGWVCQLVLLNPRNTGWFSASSAMETAKAKVEKAPVRNAADLDFSFEI